MCTFIIIIMPMTVDAVSISDDHINGEAFMDLEDKDLTEIGFKKGQHMKVLKIIQSVKVRYVIELATGNHN